MGTAELIEILRAEARDADEELEAVARRIAAHLPDEPLTEEWILEVLRPLQPLEAVRVFRLLAELGRMEWVGIAERMLAGADAFVRLRLADVLLTAKSGKAPATLRELYYGHRDRKDGKDRVTVDWIIEALHEHEGDESADALRREIVAEERARYEARRKTS